MGKRKTKFPWRDGAQIEYMVQHSLEAGHGTAKAIRGYLSDWGVEYTSKQITQALQRLKRAGATQNAAHAWELV